MGLFEIHVDLWQWILSQVIGVIALVFVFLAFQQKTKSKQLMWQAVVNFMTILVAILLFNWIVVGVSSVAFLKNITFMFTNKRKQKPSKSLLVFFFILFSILNITTMALTWYFASFHIIDVFLLTGLVAVNYGKALGNIHTMKIPALSNSVFLLINAVMFRDAMAVLKSMVAISSITIFYFKFLKARKKDANPAPPQEQELPIESSSV